MESLALRLAASDPEAASALRVIRHFDALLESGAGLQSIVRGVASLSGSPAQFTDPARDFTVRVLPDGWAATPTVAADPRWPVVAVTEDRATLWLERVSAPAPVHTVILERAAGAARHYIARTHRLTAIDGTASPQSLFDSALDEKVRVRLGRRLGLTDSSRVWALKGGASRIFASDVVPDGTARVGLSRPARIEGLPEAWREAQMALRFAANGTRTDPGARVVFADDLGLLADLLDPAVRDFEAAPDVARLKEAVAMGSWVLATLDAVAAAPSLRDAARRLHLHHSTLQARLVPVETVLGWGELGSQQAKHRLFVALAAWRVLRADGHDPS